MGTHHRGVTSSPSSRKSPETRPQPQRHDVQQTQAATRGAIVERTQQPTSKRERRRANKARKSGNANEPRQGSKIVTSRDATPATQQPVAERPALPTPTPPVQEPVASAPAPAQPKRKKKKNNQPRAPRESSASVEVSESAVSGVISIIRSRLQEIPKGRKNNKKRDALANEAVTELSSALGIPPGSQSVAAAKIRQRISNELPGLVDALEEISEVIR